jgi:hypothetical protein
MGPSPSAVLRVRLRILRIRHNASVWLSLLFTVSGVIVIHQTLILSEAEDDNVGRDANTGALQTLER